MRKALLAVALLAASVAAKHAPAGWVPKKEGGDYMDKANHNMGAGIYHDDVDYKKLQKDRDENNQERPLSDKERLRRANALGPGRVDSPEYDEPARVNLPNHPSDLKSTKKSVSTLYSPDSLFSQLTFVPLFFCPSLF